MQQTIIMLSSAEFVCQQLFLMMYPLSYIRSLLPLQAVILRFCEGDPIQLTAETVQGASYYWTGPNGFTSTEQNPYISSTTALYSGSYTLVVTANGCSSTAATLIVFVNECCINIPEGFSPNADGINDYYVIRGIDCYPNNSIIIYNRWGNKVYEASPYKNDWDGRTDFGITIGGDKLPVGTYFYLLNLGDGSDIIKGFIYLNK
jgi:gliding motility-associated-like protein